MKIPLGIALTLHALLLGAGARWARTKPAASWPVVPGAVEIAIGPPAPVPEPVAAPAAEPAASQGGPPRGQASPGGPPHRTAATVPAVNDDRLRAWLARASETPAPAELPFGASGGKGKGRDGSAGEEGDGEGRGGAARRRKRRGLGESWDSVAGPRSEDAPDGAAPADEQSLPRRTLDAVVARSAGRLRLCYQDGLRREPDLAGRITVRFSVDAGGSVLLASDAGTTVADPAVIRCVLSAFAAMTFPARGQGGAVWASYLVAFPPG